MSKFHLPHDHGTTPEDIRDTMPSTESARILADIFKQLGDGTRIRIFWLLCHYEECVINISAIMEMSSPAVSHHLKKLKETGLIEARRVGKEVYYRASDTEQANLLHHVAEAMMKVSCPGE